MTCPNVKVKMVKLHDTKFYCCSEFKFELEDPDGTNAGNWTYCPWCRTKLSINGS